MFIAVVVLNTSTQTCRQPQQQLMAGQPAGVVQPDWRAFNRSAQDAHNFTMETISDVYKDKRDAGATGWTKSTNAPMTTGTGTMIEG